MRLGYIVFCILASTFYVSAQRVIGDDNTRTREITVLNDGWTFHRGEVIGDPSVADYDVSLWEIGTIDCSRKSECKETEWFRRGFDVDLTQNVVPGGRRIFFRFDGTVGDAQVFVNGHKIGCVAYDLDSWECEATDAINGDGRGNMIAVRIDDKSDSSRCDSGKRPLGNVSLVATNRVHVPFGGYNVSAACQGAQAEVCVRTEVCGVRNEELALVTSIMDSNTNQKVISSSAIELMDRTVEENGDTTVTVVQHLVIDNPRLWSPTNPSLYEAITDVYVWFRPKSKNPFGFSVAPKMLHSDVISIKFGIYENNKKDIKS